MSQARGGAYTPQRRDERAGFGPLDATEPPARRGGLLLAVAGVVVIAFAGVIWSAYRQGFREESWDAAQRVAADPRPIKVEPDEPGGAEVRDLDKAVYSLLDTPRSDTAEDGPVVLGVIEERPGESPIVSPLSASGATPADAKEPAAQPGPVTLAEARLAPEEPVSTAPSSPASVRADPLPPAPALALTPAPTPPPVAAAPSTAPRVTPAVAEAPLVTVPSAASYLTPNGAFLVQVASFTTPDAATVAWDRLRLRLPELLANAESSIVQADLGERGVRHRLRVAAFAERQHAAAFCDALKSRGQDCLVVGR